MAEESKKLIDVGKESIKLTDPAALVGFATTLKKFIVDQGLYVEIQKRNYALVEAWQFAGGAMGVLPLVTSLVRVEDETVKDGEIRYRAEIELRNINDDRLVGIGVAICSNLEGGRKAQDEYVIASMAQTRAIGKAYRNSIGWLLKLAGYEATPAEEAQGSVGANLEPGIESKITEAKTPKELEDILASLPAEQKKTAQLLITQRLAEIRDSEQTVAPVVKKADDTATN